MSVNVYEGENLATTGSLATSTATVTAGNVNGYPTLLVTIHGTYAGLNVVFELSDDGMVTWYNAVAKTTGGFIINTGTTAPGDNSNNSWWVNTAGAKQFRVRATALTSGSASVRITPIGLTQTPWASVSVQDISGVSVFPVNVTQWGGTSTTLGQKAMASSVPVVVASDQSILTISGTVTSNQGTPNSATNRWPVQVTDGTVSFTAGQKNIGNSFPVTLASDQPIIGVNISSYGATLTTLGQKVMASSMPVVIASDQSSLPITFSSLMILKNNTFNTSVTANTNILGTALTPTTTPTRFRIYAAFQSSGVLTVKRTNGVNTVSEQMNSGINLNSNAAYIFDITVDSGDSINYQYSVNATASKLATYEIDNAT